MRQAYLDSARLITRVAPIVFADAIFALKGGTAINFFFRDMPRLSVDLDLVFVDHQASRAEALASINSAIDRAAERLDRSGFNVHIPAHPELGHIKVIANRGYVSVMAEVNPVIRGTINPVVTKRLAPRAREVLLADLELPVVSLEDAYGGKLVAALDRQHPRDLFDVMQLFAQEGISPAITHAFLVYLVSHDRPIHEVLFPTKKDILHEFEGTFSGMTAEPVALEDLLAARERLMTELTAGLSADERQFLISLVNASPDWSLLGGGHLEQLPAIRWKLQNLERLAETNRRKFREQADELERRLSTLN